MTSFQDYAIRAVWINADCQYYFNVHNAKLTFFIIINLFLWWEPQHKILLDPRENIAFLPAPQHLINKKKSVVSLIVRFVGYYTSRFFCVNHWEAEKYFIFLLYLLKSKVTLSMSLYQDLVNTGT
jgi:hypothetical protein